MIKSPASTLLAIGLAIMIGSPQYSPTTARSEAITQVSSPDSPIPLQQLPSLGPKVPAGWWQDAQESIRKSEYHVTWQEQTYLAELPAAYQAPNRAQNLRTYFTPQGAVLIPRVFPDMVKTPPWRWQLALSAWGWTNRLIPAGEAELSAREQRMEYRRPGILEWYENRESGLEHGMTVHAAPEGNEQGVALQICFALGGDLIPRPTSQGGRVAFVDSAGRQVLDYNDLKVNDAAGKTLPAQIKLAPGKMYLEIQAQGAQYPLQIDPTIRGLQPSSDWGITMGQVGAKFGWSVASAGDVNGDGCSDLLVGAPDYDGGNTDEGRVYLYHGESSGLQTISSWYKEGEQDGAGFGWSVAGAGDVNGDGYADILIGAPYYDIAFTDEGGAWLYLGSSSGLGSTAARLIVGGQEGARLGYSVSSAGDVNGDWMSDFMVGAPYADAPESDEGKAYLWYGHAPATGISWGADWTAETDQAGAHLGQSIAWAGDVNGDGYSDIIIGAPFCTDGQPQEGLALIFHGGAAGMGANGLPANADWIGQMNQSSARYGISVSTAGDVNGDGYADVVVGANLYDNGQIDEGGAWVYYGGSGGLDTAFANQDEGNQAGAWFGFCVASAGDVNGDGYADVIVGAPLYTNPSTEEGKVWVWYGGTSGIAGSNDWNFELNASEAWLGNSVASGDFNGDGYSDVVIGAPGDASESGTALAFYGGPDRLNSSVNWIKSSGRANTSFGWSVAGAGDVNRDGYADILVGAPYWDDGQTDEGGAWLYTGSSSGVVDAPAWYKPSNQAGALFGYSVSPAGDVNGDGYSDVIVGASNWTDGQTNEGGAWIYHGNTTDLDDAPSLYKQGDQAGAQFGFSVSTAGDVNGDGYSDVIVGAPYYQYINHPGEGMAWVYHGSPGGVLSTPKWSKDSDQDNANFGWSVGTAGDVNRDGYSEVIVGAPMWEDDHINEGAAWVYQGTPNGLNSAPYWHSEANVNGSWYGAAVGTAGDVNGDGYSDVIVGAPMWSSTPDQEGGAWVFHGGLAGLDTGSSWHLESGIMGTQFGASVATAGDVNGDGYSDVIVGSPHRSNGQSEEGCAHVYLGGPGGLDTTESWMGESDQSGALFGYAVAGAGDVNADGYADVLVGATGWNGGSTNEGRAYLFYGNASKGRSRPLRQGYTAGGLGYPVAHLGRTKTSGQIAISTMMRTGIYGRAGLRMWYEVKPLGTAMNGSGLVGGSYYSPTPGGTGHIWMAINNLSPNTPYHWRVRLCYRPDAVPFQTCERWLSIPRNGWNETDLRTAPGVYLPLIIK